VFVFVFVLLVKVAERAFAYRGTHKHLQIEGFIFIAFIAYFAYFITFLSILYFALLKKRNAFVLSIK
jgi:hypothetical protein